MIRLGVFVVLVTIGCVRAHENNINNFRGIFDELTKLTGELKLPEDAGLNISQLLDKYGFPLEYHDVETEDGWTLTMHRIPYGRNQVPEANAAKPVIFFGHPLVGCSMNWVFRAPNVSLALQLADEGYDIWLGNTRGNQNSLKHKTLTPKDKEFWNFSFHEKGFIDTAAMIDYVLAHTKVDKLTYVGHSQGTAEIIVLTSTKPEYNDKFNLITMLSPIAFMNHVSKNPIAAITAVSLNLIQDLSNLLKFYGLYQTKLVTDVFEAICCQPGIMQDMCLFTVQLVVGFDEDQTSKDIMSLIFSSNFGGVAVKELFHYLQEMNSGYFRQYDYGNETNLQLYGTVEPPSYDVSKITAPLALYYSKQDKLGRAEDVEYLMTQLTNANIVDDYLVEYEKFNHLDFLTAIDVQELLYDRVLDVINKANKK